MFKNSNRLVGKKSADGLNGTYLQLLLDERVLRKEEVHSAVHKSKILTKRGTSEVSKSNVR
jgi:hypothetical protein